MQTPFRLTVLLILTASHCGIRFADGQELQDAPRLELPQTPDRYADLPLPKHFLTPQAQVFDITPEDNVLTDAGATLGRVLFYDTRLSINNSISCGSCHFQEHAFSDPRPLSPGHEGVLVDRNAMSLVNLRFMRTGAFWDERGGTLEQQVLMPIESSVEMGHRLPDVVEILKSDKHYPSLFQAAFGDHQIDRDRIAKALAQFVRSMLSYQSKYDAGAAQAHSMAEDFANFTSAENHGKSLFLTHCAVCHRPARDTQMAHFDLFRSLNNGVDATATPQDTGRGDITFDLSETGLFKSSSLRNVEFTAPYMHDGRFATLEEVIEHYSTGVQRHPLVSSNVFRMQLSDDEKQAVIAFLKTLSDEHFINDPKFSDPWVWPGDSPNRLHHLQAVQTSHRNSTSSFSRDSDAPDDRNQADAKSLTAEDLNKLIEAGSGLPPESTLNWLRSLDSSGDASLSRDEYRKVVQLLAETDAALRPDELETNPAARRNRPATSINHYPAEIVQVADFNRDGQLDPQEARRYELFKRFMELRDGGRIESRLDGLMSNFIALIEEEKFLDARSRVRASKQQLHEQTLVLDGKLINQIRELLDGNEWTAFQLAAMNDLGNTSNRGREERNTESAIEKTLAEHFERFDRNQDGLLDESELQRVARALNELTGGFGQRRGEGATLQQFERRLLSFGSVPNEVRLDELPDRLIVFMTPADIDGDGTLGLQEVSDFVREEGFRQISEHGIYVGGGFESIFTRVKMDELPIDDEKKELLKSLLDSYAARLLQLQTESILANYPILTD